MTTTTESQWDNILAQYMSSIYNESTTEDERHETTRLFLDTLYTVYHQALKQVKARDHWAEFYGLPPFGLYVSLYSKRLLAGFRFGIYLDKIYTEVSLRYEQYLRHMNDDFWSLLLSLKDIGKLSFEPTNYPTVDDENPNIKILFKNDVSSVFNICRNFVLMTQIDGEEIEGLGSFRIEWDYQTPFTDLLEKLTEATRVLYRLQYLLYRPYYQHRRKFLNSQFSKLTREQQDMYEGFKGFVKYFDEAEWENICSNR